MRKFTFIVEPALRSSVFKSVLWLLVAIALTACGGTKKTVVRPGHGRPVEVKEHRKTHSVKGKTNYNLDSKTSERIVKEARSWIGTPYSYGGTERDGVDCSGLTMKVFQKAAELKLPRNSAAQCEYTLSISRDDLQPGDLIFFSGSNPERVGHVGIYIGNATMIHASGSRGVVESNIDLNYWRSHYYGSGRVEALTQGRKGGKSGSKQSEVPSSQHPTTQPPAERVVPAEQVEPPAAVDELPLMKDIPAEEGADSIEQLSAPVMSESHFIWHAEEDTWQYDEDMDESYEVQTLEDIFIETDELRREMTAPVEATDSSEGEPTEANSASDEPVEEIPVSGEFDEERSSETELPAELPTVEPSRVEPQVDTPAKSDPEDTEAEAINQAVFDAFN